MEAADLGPGEVEAIAKHEVLPRDLRLGFAAQTAAEELVAYKLRRLLALSGAEPTKVELVWVCQGRAVGKKGSTRTLEGGASYRKALPPPPQPPGCTVCGVRATEVADVPAKDYPGFIQHEPRCAIHA